MLVILMNNWKDIVYFIKINKNNKDGDGFPIPEETKSDPIVSNIIGVTRAEEEHANKMGYTADLEVEIMSVNYDNQEILETEDGNRFRIRRTYPKTSEILSLTCSNISVGT